MTASVDALPDSLDATTAAGQRAARTRWWFVAGVMVIAPLALVVAGILAVVLWLLAQHGAALRQVQAEVARIQGAGEPITTADLYAYHRVPEGTRDTTRLWLAALGGVNEQNFNADAKPLPIVGEALGTALPPGDLLAAEQLLAKYDLSVQATLVAAAAEGEARIPVKFDDGFSALLPNVKKMRLLSRLMMLRGRVAVAKGNREQAVESVEAMFGASRALSHQVLLIEHLVRLATARMALSEVEFVMNELPLTDEELVRLQGHVQALDFGGGLEKSLWGERAVGYFAFHHPEQMTGGNISAKPSPGEGTLTRAADCRVYLEMQADLIAAAEEPFPQALAAADAVEKRLMLLAGSRNPVERYNHMFTLLIMPASRASFDATARNLAERDLTLCALAARRHELKNGDLPASLEALVPEFLPTVPADPFTGQPLKMQASADGLTLYSVAANQQDDGGNETDDTSELDIVVRILRRP